MRRITPWALWDRFWFTPKPTHTLGLFRILFGAFVLLLIATSAPNWERFYGPSGIIEHAFFRMPASYFLYPQCNAQLSLFRLSDAPWLTWAVFWIGILSSFTFTVGVWTRASTVVLFVTFASMYHRNPMLLNGQDSLGNLLLFFSCFAPLGRAYSLDALLVRRARAARRPPAADGVVGSAWAWRLMQVSLTILYLFAGITKLGDPHWTGGTAVYYISLFGASFRFPDVELFHQAWISRVMTYGALAIELLFPCLVWIKPLKSYALGAAWVFHASLMICMAPSIFHFNLLLTIALILYVDPGTIKRVLADARP